MADNNPEIREYARVFFNDKAGVRPSGSAKAQRIDATHAVRLYRDMRDPSTLIIQTQHQSNVDEIPWAWVVTARRKKVEKAAEAPKQEALPQGQQQGQGRGR